MRSLTQGSPQFKHWASCGSQVANMIDLCQKNDKQVIVVAHTRDIVTVDNQLKYDVDIEGRKAIAQIKRNADLIGRLRVEDRDGKKIVYFDCRPTDQNISKGHKGWFIDRHNDNALQDILDELKIRLRH